MVKKRLKSNIRQDQIIDAARKLVVKHGSEHVTVGKIAKEVGISEGAIYRHFKSKGEVLSGLADQIADDLLTDINDHIYTNFTSLRVSRHCVKEPSVNNTAKERYIFSGYSRNYQFWR